MAVRRLSKSRGLRFLSKEGLHTYLGELAENERELTAEIIEGVREAERRGLYFDYGYTSVFKYLMEEHGFSNGSAQRYIDAARLFAVVPTLTEDIASGSLKMAQVTVVATTVRQKKKEEPKFQMEAEQATAIFEKIKGENTDSSQQILAQELQVKIKEQEVARRQADGSIRREITLSKEDEEALARIKELISHTHPNPSFVEVLRLLMHDYLKRKDPLLTKERKKSAPKKTQNNFHMDKNTQEKDSAQAGSYTDEKVIDAYVLVSEQSSDLAQSSAYDESEPERQIRVEAREQDSRVVQTTVGWKDQAVDDRVIARSQSNEPVQSGDGTQALSPNYHVVATGQSNNPTQSTSDTQAHNSHVVPQPHRRRYISVHTTRLVHRRDQCCQWRNPTTGAVCGSKFQLQRDHIQSHWAGGSDEPENLQILCAQHNRLKYRGEVGIKWVAE